MATTVVDLLSRVLRDVGAFGIGQSPLPEQLQDALWRLNLLLAQWQKKSLMVYAPTTLGITSTGATTYTLGPSGDFNIASRPGHILGAYARILGGAQTPVDVPLQLMNSIVDFNAVAVKELSTLPSRVFYNPTYPTGTLHFWPVPLASVYGLYVTVPTVIGSIANLADELALPEEYEAAIYYNLLVMHYPVFRIQPDPVIVQLANATRKTIKNANSQVPMLAMPAGIARPTAYDPRSDR